MFLRLSVVAGFQSRPKSRTGWQSDTHSHTLCSWGGANRSNKCANVNKDSDLVDGRRGRDKNSHYLPSLLNNTCLFMKWFRCAADTLHAVCCIFSGWFTEALRTVGALLRFLFLFFFASVRMCPRGVKNQTNLAYNNNNNNKQEKLLGWGNTQKYVTNHVIGFWLTLFPIRTIHFFELLPGEGGLNRKYSMLRPIICGACKRSENQTDTKFDLEWQIKISFNSGNTQRDLGRS